jgi:hypothetical protein
MDILVEKDFECGLMLIDGRVLWGGILLLMKAGKILLDEHIVAVVIQLFLLIVIMISSLRSVEGNSAVSSNCY